MLKSEAIKKTSEFVRFSIESEVGRWSEIYFPSAKSVGEPVLAI